jgi:hypothetical protein
MTFSVSKSPVSAWMTVGCSPLLLAQPTNVPESAMSAAEPAFETCDRQMQAFSSSFASSSTSYVPEKLASDLRADSASCQAKSQASNLALKRFYFLSPFLDRSPRPSRNASPLITVSGWQMPAHQQGIDQSPYCNEPSRVQNQRVHRTSFLPLGGHCTPGGLRSATCAGLDTLKALNSPRGFCGMV